MSPLERYRELLLAKHREFLNERSRKYYKAHRARLRRRARRQGKERYQRYRQYYKDYHVKYYAEFREFILRKKRVSKMRKRRRAQEEAKGAWEHRTGADQETRREMLAAKACSMKIEICKAPSVESWSVWVDQEYIGDFTPVEIALELKRPEKNPKFLRLEMTLGAADEKRVLKFLGAR